MHRLLPVLVITLVACGCAVHYSKHGQTNALRVYHNAEHPPHDLDLEWAEAAVITLALEFGVELGELTPIDVYIDCEDESRRPSRFNRFTKSVVLRFGQAEIHRLFIHELTHLVLDAVDGSPPYWIDQGLAELMETRVGDPFDDRPALLLPPRLNLSRGRLEEVARSSVADVLDGISREAIDGGDSLSAALLHYLTAYRWSGRPFSQQVRKLLELGPDDLPVIAADFVSFCGSYDPIDDFFRGYHRSSPQVRLALMSEVHSRHFTQRSGVFRRLLQTERDPALVRLAAIGLLMSSPVQSVGRVFDEVAGIVAPEPIPELDRSRSKVLASYLLEEVDLQPDDWRFPLVAEFLASEERWPRPSAAEAESWLRRWPGPAAPFAGRSDVQARFVETIESLEVDVLESLLGGLELSAAGDPSTAFASAGESGAPLATGSGAAGTLQLAQPVRAVSRRRFPGLPAWLHAGLWPVERRAALVAKLETLLHRRPTSAWKQRARIRAAALLLYFGGSLDGFFADARGPVNEDASDLPDVVAFATIALDARQRAELSHLP